MGGCQGHRGEGGGVAEVPPGDGVDSGCSGAGGVGGSAESCVLGTDSEVWCKGGSEGKFCRFHGEGSGAVLSPTTSAVSGSCCGEVGGASECALVADFDIRTEPQSVALAAGEADVVIRKEEVVVSQEAALCPASFVLDAGIGVGHSGCSGGGAAELSDVVQGAALTGGDAGAGPLVAATKKRLSQKQRKKIKEATGSLAVEPGTSSPKPEVSGRVADLSAQYIRSHAELEKEAKVLQAHLEELSKAEEILRAAARVHRDAWLVGGWSFCSAVDEEQIAEVMQWHRAELEEFDSLDGAQSQ